MYKVSLFGCAKHKQFTKQRLKNMDIHYNILLEVCTAGKLRNQADDWRQNMKYYIPTKVYQEIDAVKVHAEELAGYGSYALIVTGKYSARANGALADVEAALDAYGKKHVQYDGIEENPSVETVMKATEFGKRNGVDFVIAIGGGSPMDAAKAIAIMLANPEKDAEYLYENVAHTKALPVVTIPTTCGTGSEVTGVAVLTVHAKRTKASLPHRVFPVLALADPKYLKTASKKVIGQTAIDALGHMIESYLNTTATDYSRMFVDQGLKVWARSKDALLGMREMTDEDYSNFLLASTLAGMAIAQTGTTIPHSLSYAITYELGVPHGIAIGYFLPGYIREADIADQEYLLSTIGFSSVDEFADFFQVVSDCGILPEENIRQVVDIVVENKAKLALCPYPLDKEVLLRIASWRK